MKTDKKTCRIRGVIAELAVVFMLAACTAPGDNETLDRNQVNESEPESYAGEQNTADAGSADVSEEQMETYRESEITQQNTAAVEQNPEEETPVDQIQVSINLISAGNMPLASDSLVYRGGDMRYGAVIKNANDFKVTMTFMMFVNGTIQPFVPEGEREETESAAFNMAEGEEKIIHFSFRPVHVLNDERSLLSLTAVAVRQDPAKSLNNILMNAECTDYGIALVSEKREYNVDSEEEINPAGTVKEQLKEENYGGGISLSDREENQTVISKIRTGYIKLDDARMYAATEPDSNTRIYLLNNGVLLNAFNGRLYGDLLKSECFYELRFDKEKFDKSGVNKCLLIAIRMDRIKKYCAGGDDGLAGAVFTNSQLFLLSENIAEN